MQHDEQCEYAASIKKWIHTIKTVQFMLLKRKGHEVWVCMFRGDIQDYFISILTFAFFVHIFNSIWWRIKEDQSLPNISVWMLLDGKIIESEFLACCMCSSFEWDYGNGKNFSFQLSAHVFNGAKHFSKSSDVQRLGREIWVL